MNFDFKNGYKNEFKDNNENHEADPKIGFLTKSISNPYGSSTAMPPAWELKQKYVLLQAESSESTIKTFVMPCVS